MLDKLHAKGVATSQMRFFPNWVDIAHIQPLAEPSSYRVELGIAPNVKVLLFSGTLGSKQGLMVIPEAAKKLAHRMDLLFVICGDGMMKPQLQAASEGVQNIKFLPLQPFEKLGQLLGLADVHLLPQSPEAADLVLPSKLSGMLASGRPVIATCKLETEIARVVSKCGLVVPPEDSAALVNAIEFMFEDDETRLELGLQARLYAKESFDKNNVLERLSNQLHFISNTKLVTGQLSSTVGRVLVEPVS
jgi:colanic acid biosynthesis glycosyl transferase WcaI